ncbi:helix-turn-helix protein [Arcicella aurantiaca]|uniref:Helix-turn-helix protein n=1 Tax=Arcicella aurantiaca TaxID=591202 RepID=A0A316DGN6_9BACT|nr:helix-turn-helix domain-containing protein [Arcicella aurantiaca]PWK17055.1 helix-turn-helix protein [Arcicella aurantiaca]
MTGQQVKKMRLEMGLTQREFSLKIGLKTQSPLSKIEDGFMDCIPYSSKIKEVFEEYKQKRIAHLEREISFLRSFF